jgi:RAT1-interacting protein
LNKIFLTPYNPHEDWEVGVERRGDGVLLLHVRETARKRASEANRDERGQRMAYWGYKFEQLSTLTEEQGAEAQRDKAALGGGYRVPSPTDAGSYDHLYPPNELCELRALYDAEGRGGSSAGDGPRAANDASVNANEEFCSIVQLSIENMKLLMAAEIDCVAAKQGNSSGGYVELKTTKQLSTAHDTEVFERHKLLKFWLQSFLAGVPSIVVGFRDDGGVVRELKTYETRVVHRIVRPKGYWDTTACFNFGKGVLDWVRKEVEAHKGSGSSHFVMRYEPSRREIVLLDDAAGAPAAGLDVGQSEEDGSPQAKRRRTTGD